MVSEKVIVALIIIAILLSVVSVVVTVSTVNTKMIPKPSVQYEQGVTSDTDSGKVNIVIDSPPQS